MYAEPEAPALHCPRCRSEDIEALGRVHSSLYWFSCFRCHCIWWLRSLPAESRLPHKPVERP